MPLINVSKGQSVVPTFINNATLPINGELIEPVISANTGETLHYFQSADEATCEQACNAAANAFKTWKRSTIATRRALLDKVITLLEERGRQLSEISARETSSTTDAQFAMNVPVTIRARQETSAVISQIRGEIAPNDDGGTTHVFKEPIGTALIIPPWNGAILLCMKAIAGALAAGCTVVVKMSELCPLTHHTIVEIFRDAGLPAGVLNAVCVRRADAAKITEALIANSHIRKIEFIGSANVGRIIASTAGKHLKPVLMELGGKAPFIVCEDADLDKAATMATRGALFHHGQICVGTERIIVLQSIADAFIEKLKKAFEAAEAGTAAHKQFADHAYDVVKDAQAKGARFLVGGPGYKTPNSVKPALLQIDASTPADRMRIIDEETFGPSAVVYVVEDDEEAIALANRTIYGLAAAVHTKDMARAMRIGRELEFGQIAMNGITVGTNPMGRFQGIKASGWGHGRGKDMLEEWTVDRTMTWTV